MSTPRPLVHAVLVHRRRHNATDSRRVEPATEELQPDEVRVVFMGSTYYPNQSQSGMSIFVELGNGDNFVFDLGIGSLRSYNSFSIPFNTINHVLFTHLHMDHMSDLPFHDVPAHPGRMDPAAHQRPERVEEAVRSRPRRSRCHRRTGSYPSPMGHALNSRLVHAATQMPPDTNSRRLRRRSEAREGLSK
jgi:hypothetical protein